MQAVYECYGSAAAGSLLTIFGRLFTMFIQMYGLTCGMDDLMLMDKAEVSRKEKLSSANRSGYDVYASLAEVTPLSNPANRYDEHELLDGRYLKSAVQASIETFLKDPQNGKKIDGEAKKVLNKIGSDVVRQSIPAGQVCLCIHCTDGLSVRPGLVRL